MTALDEHAGGRETHRAHEAGEPDDRTGGAAATGTAPVPASRAVWTEADRDAGNLSKDSDRNSGKDSGKDPGKAAKRMRPPAGKSVGWALVQAARLHRARVGDRLADLGLFAGQEQVVQALATTDSMTMGDLAATLRVRPPTASKTISRLAALGIVERRAEAGDGRVVRVRLTEAGLAKADAIEGLWDEVEAELLDDFEGKERRRLRKLLRRAAHNLAGAAGMSGHDPDPETDGDLDDEAEGPVPGSRPS